MNLPTQTFSLIVSDFLSLFFPNYCATCNLTLSRSETLICSHCLSNLNRTDLHLDQSNQLHANLFEINQLKYAMSFTWFQKGTVIQKLLHQLKYEGNEAVGVLLGQLYGEELLPYYKNEWDIISCVPIHYKKERKRGYNQSEKIAEGLSQSLGIPFRVLLEKPQNTKTQTKKHRVERFNNVESSFQIKNEELILEDKKVLLIDDVITTGATIQACCQPLIRAGSEVSIASISCVRR